MLTLLGGDNHLVFPSPHKNWKLCKGTFSVQFSLCCNKLLVSENKYLLLVILLDKFVGHFGFPKVQSYHVTMPLHIGVFETSANYIDQSAMLDFESNKNHVRKYQSYN